MKILIAEDDPVTRTLLRRILSAMSHRVVEAGNGLVALEKIEAENPDLLLTDVHMPELDGRMLVETVRASKTHGRMPIICMSAVKDKAEIVGLISLGIQGYILKPINPADVRERFSRVIAEHGDWRRQPEPDGRETLLLVDPDAKFREMARGLLETRFAVIDAASGAHALRLYNDGAVKPSVVMVADGLPLIDEVRLTQFIRASAEARQVKPPEFWLVSEADSPAHEVLSSFAGHLKRSLEAEAFTAELERAGLHGAAVESKVAE